MPDTLINLRAPEPEDLDLLYLWENDASAWHTSFSTGPLSRHQIAEYIDSYDGDIYTALSLRFIIEADQAPVGTIDVFDFNRRGRHAFIGIYIARSFRHRGIASAALTALIKMLGERVGMISLVALVASENLPSLKLFKSVGFEETGILKRWIGRGSELKDAVILQFVLRPSDGR